MLKKKLMAVVAACALALALPTAAFAADGWDFGNTINGPSIDNESFDTSSESYLCKASVDVSNASSGAKLSLTGPESAIGANVAISGALTGTGTMGTGVFAPTGAKYATFSIDIPTGTTGTVTFTITKSAPAPAPAPTDPTDQNTPAVDNTDNGTAGNTDNAAADDNNAASDSENATDKSKTAPKTGVDMGGFALATAGALAAAGCVVFALRKKIAINE